MRPPSDSERQAELIACAGRVANAAAACVDAINRKGNLKGRVHRLRHHVDAFRKAQGAMAGRPIPSTGDNLRAILSFRSTLLQAANDTRRVREYLYSVDECDDVLADRIIGLSWNRVRDPIVIVGDGADGLVNALAQRGVRRIVVLDRTPDKVIRHATVIDDPYKTRGALGQWTLNRPRTALVYRHGGDDADHRVVQEEVREGLDAFQLCMNTIDVFGQVWVEQGIQNLPIIAANPGIGSITASGAFKGVPMVIIASGPSLSRNVHQLAALKGKALLVTFSHTLGALLRAGIEPDAVLALDPEDLRYHFRDYDTSRLEAMMLGATIHPEVPRLPAKRIFTFAANQTVDSWIYKSLVDKNMVSTGGSVACTALALAITWGCSCAILVGQDLAYTDGEVYAKGIADDVAKAEIVDGKLQVKDWSADYAKMQTIGNATATVPEDVVWVKEWHGSEPVLKDGKRVSGGIGTSYIFHIYRKWFENAIRSYPEFPVWNCTEGGSYIAGAKHVPLADVVPTITAEHDIPALFDRAMADFDRGSAQGSMLAQARVMLADVREAVEIASACSELAKCPDDSPPAELRPMTERLEQVMKKVEYLILSVHHYLRTQDEIEPGDFVAQNNAARENYQHIVQSGSRLIPLIERAIDDIERD